MSPRLLLGAGVACLALGVALLAERLIFIGRSDSAVGEVTVKDAARYTIRFQSQGSVVDINRPLPADADERARLKVGQSVPLRFMPDSPQDARTFGVEFWFFPLGLLLVGSLGLFAARYTRRRPV